MDGLGNEQELLAKARAAGSPPHDVLHRMEELAEPAAEGPPSGGVSWRDAAKAVKLKPRDAYPKIHEFERSVLPSVRTLRAQFVCALCPHCQRPLIRSVLALHVPECEQRILAEKRRSRKLELDAGSSSVKVEEAVPASSGSRKKRKIGDDDAGSSAKATGDDTAGALKHAKSAAKGKNAKTTKSSKKSKTASSKPPKQAKHSKEKPAAVYNPDKNCGVPLPSGQPCMRSLTCKQHSMGAKRAVPGRSASYDILLGNYHRQHQMKQAQLSASAAQAAQLESDQLQEAQAQQNPDREVHQVLEGVSRVFCSPLAMGRVSSTSSRTTNFRLREMLAVALLPRRLPPTGDVLYGRSLAFNQDAPDKLMYVRSQAVQQALYLSQLQQRQMQLRRQAETNMHSSNGQVPRQTPGAPTSARPSQYDQRGMQPPGQHGQQGQQN